VALILDTNALSAYADADPAILDPVRKAAVVSLPVIVLGEYRLGIQESRHRAQYEAWLDEWIARTIILPVDMETARFYASIGFDLKKRGKPIPVNDLWISALCLQHKMPLLSRDHHFDVIPTLRRISW